MGVVHTDMTEPYCPHLRKGLTQAAAAIAHQAHDGGVYVCTEGPRFETPAEIKMYRHMGGDLVGMTSFPEVALAREVGNVLCHHCHGDKLCCGVSPTHLTHEEVLEVMAENSATIKSLLLAAIPLIAGNGDCQCRGTAGPVK